MSDRLNSSGVELSVGAVILPTAYICLFGRLSAISQLWKAIFDCLVEGYRLCSDHLFGGLLLTVRSSKMHAKGKCKGGTFPPDPSSRDHRNSTAPVQYLYIPGIYMCFSIYLQLFDHDSGRYYLPVAPVAYQAILEPGIGQFREFESPRVHTRMNSWRLFFAHKLTCGKRERVS